MHTLIIGAGFSGYKIAEQALSFGSVCGTRRQPSSLKELEQGGFESIVLDATENYHNNQHQDLLEQLKAQCLRATHLVICVAPDRVEPFNDPVHRLLSHASIQFSSLQWVGYLSTIGVYGNHDGAWIDETTSCGSEQVRSIMRLKAESAWNSFADTWQVPLVCLRLSGIYGPNRNAIKDALSGRARMLIKPGQVFNRIHVEDLARATMSAARLKYSGILNISDDLPAPPQDVVRYAHELVGKAPPSAIDFATAQISDMARSFYKENKRVSNALSKQALDFDYRYPTYKEGLTAIWSHLSVLER